MMRSRARLPSSTGAAHAGQSRGVRFRPDAYMREWDEDLGEDYLKGGCRLRKTTMSRESIERIAQLVDADEDYEDEYLGRQMSRHRANILGRGPPVAVGRFVTSNMCDYRGLPGKASKIARPTDNLSNGGYRADEHQGGSTLMTSNMMDYQGRCGQAAELARPRDNLLSGGRVASDHSRDRMMRTNHRRADGSASAGEEELITTHMQDYRGVQAPHAKLAQPRDNLLSGGRVASDHSRDKSRDRMMCACRRRADLSASAGEEELITTHMQDYRGVQAPHAKLAQPRDNLKCHGLPAADKQQDKYRGSHRYGARRRTAEPESVRQSEYISTYNDTYRGIQGWAAESAKPRDNLTSSSEAAMASSEYRDNFQGYTTSGRRRKRSDYVCAAGLKMYAPTYKESTVLLGEPSRLVRPRDNLISSDYNANVAKQHHRQYRDSVRERVRFEPNWSNSYAVATDRSGHLPVIRREKINRAGVAFH